MEAKELAYLRKEIEEEIEDLFKELGARVEYKLGTMIEIPRACLLADEIAEYADFFSFGTNDLTQMSMGLSRDDSVKFLDDYREKGIWEGEPFYSIDTKAVTKLVEIGEKIGDETMENQTLKMLESASAFSLADCVDYKEGQIVSKNLVAKSNLVITVMSFWKGESLDPHKAPGDALVTVLDGEGKYIVDGKAFVVKKGESAVLPANVPHAVEAETQNFKMMLTLVK